MTLPIWHLKESNASLNAGPLSARIDLADPGHGLVDIDLGGHRLANLGLLGIEWPPSSAAAETAPQSEWHVRGPDLMATYPATPERPFRIDSMWRVLDTADLPEVLAGIELIVSVHTELLDSQPAISVASRILAEEDVTRLSGGSLPADTWTSRRMSESTTLRPEKPGGCTLARLPGGKTSYVEMVHPADARGGPLEFDIDAGPRVRTAQKLFCRPLEKGVILRARVRGLFVPRENDTQAAIQSHARFAESEPPLSV